MQKWEYKTIFRKRGLPGQDPKDAYVHTLGWSYYSEDGNKISDDDIDVILSRLGEQGWELVSISPRSSITGGVSTIYGFTANLVGGGKTEGCSTDYAGLTTEELWVFKRPKA
jgi:hypothetical protein